MDKLQNFVARRTQGVKQVINPGAIRGNFAGFESFMRLRASLKKHGCTKAKYKSKLMMTGSLQKTQTTERYGKRWIQLKYLHFITQKRQSQRSF